MAFTKLRWSFLLLVLLIVTKSWAAHCSLQTLKGVYGLDEAGTIIVPTTQLFVTNGTSIYDGNGNLSGSVTLNMGMPLQATFTGTYTINADCSYSDSVMVVFPFGVTPLNHKGMVVRHGISQEVLVTGADPGTASAATIRRAPVGRCSLESLKGTYGAVERGQMVVAAPPVFPQGPFVNIANAIFDGAGHFSGEYMAVIGDGTVRTGEFSGKYTVGPECTYTDEFIVTGTPVPGLTLHHQGSIAGEGILQEVHFIYTDPVSVVSGILVKQ